MNAFPLILRRCSAARSLLATPARMAFAFAGLLACASPVFAQFKDQIGFTQLQSEYPNLPTGRNLTVFQGEGAPDWTNYTWATSATDELAGKIVTYLPAGTNPTAFSSHANGVAADLIGLSTSIIPDVPRLISCQDTAYINDTLHIEQPIAPMVATWDLENHSWCWSDPTYSVGILRRADWRVDNQGVTIVSAVANGNVPMQYVLTSSYNGIAAGVTVGTHSPGGTLIEVVGRIKPDIVAPAVWTSNATPIVASCAGLLIDQAKADARFAVAKDPRVIKALLLAGATKQEIPGWSNSPTQPLDVHFGAGQVNIANSYHMLMSGQQPASNAWLSLLGWDKSTSGGGQYFIEIPAGKTATFSVVLTWHRTITPNANWSVLTPALADLNLRLSTASAEFAVGALVAESRSAIDNVEHVYQTSLPPGRYVLEVTGPAGVPYGIAWRSSLADVEPPAVTTQPSTQIATLGGSTSFTATASGNPAPTCQWQRSNDGGATWSNLAATAPCLGTTDGTLTIVSATAAMNGDQYRCVETNLAGSATTSPAILVVNNSLAVVTVAGLAGSSGGADGNGSTARFVDPSDVAIDAGGNLYVADAGNHAVRKITPTGVVTTLAGLTGVSGSSDGSGSARFNHPTGVTVDSSGNVYVADTDNNEIRKVTASGVVSTLAGVAGVRGSGDGTGSAASFNGPSGIVADPTGNLYVADTLNHTIRKVSSAGVVTTIAGVAGASGAVDAAGSAARFNGPQGLALDAANHLYVADTNNDVIRQIVTSSGAVTTVAGQAGIAGGADGANREAEFHYPSSVAVDATGNLYVADTDNHTVREIESSGAVSTLAGLATASGGTDGIGTAARFAFPTGIAVDSAGNIYVADTNNHTIRLAFTATAPAITLQPQSQTAAGGANITLSVTATGRPTPTYQWSCNGTAINGATGSTLNLTNVQSANAGSYTVTATNGSGSVTSNQALLTVNIAGGGDGGGEPGGGGGGGAPSLWFSGALLLLAAVRRIQEQMKARGPAALESA
jgi:sugar lactone lactonase YvrE